MFSVATMPIFNDSAWGYHQPAAPSPLSSSPIRASSPLSPLDRNSVPQRACFSSPPGPPSKFASRPSKPNPLLRKREEGQETRRQLFLKNVRGRANDKAWERRSIEGHAVRKWHEEQRQISRQKELDTTGIPSEADFEDAATLAEASQQEYEAMMADYVARQEEAELEALLSLQQEAQSTSAAKSQADSAGPPPSDYYVADDDGFDEIFMQLSQNEPQNGDAMDTC